MDRIDIHMQVPRVEYQKLRDMRKGESSAEVRRRVEAAREIQRKRFEGTDIASNADMRPAQIRKYCALDDACQALMKTAMRQLQLTARAYHRVLKLSRTIAVRLYRKTNRVSIHRLMDDFSALSANCSKTCLGLKIA